MLMDLSWLAEKNTFSLFACVPLECDAVGIDDMEAEVNAGFLALEAVPLAKFDNGGFAAASSVGVDMDMVLFDCCSTLSMVRDALLLGVVSNELLLVDILLAMGVSPCSVLVVVRTGGLVSSEFLFEVDPRGVNNVALVPVSAVAVLDNEVLGVTLVEVGADEGAALLEV